MIRGVKQSTRVARTHVESFGNGAKDFAPLSVKRRSDQMFMHDSTNGAPMRLSFRQKLWLPLILSMVLIFFLSILDA